LRTYIVKTLRNYAIHFDRKDISFQRKNGNFGTFRRIKKINNKTMANYFNTLPLQITIRAIGVCEFMDQSEFTDGIAALKR
jgi:hypothetical protein